MGALGKELYVSSPTMTPNPTKSNFFQVHCRQALLARTSRDLPWFLPPYPLLACPPILQAQLHHLKSLGIHQHSHYRALCRVLALLCQRTMVVLRRHRFRFPMVGAQVPPSLVQVKELPLVCCLGWWQSSYPIHLGMLQYLHVSRSRCWRVLQSFAVFGASGNAVDFPNW